MDTTTTPAELTIRHTRADGTLIEGSRKGDGVYEIARTCGFRWFPSISAIGLPRSRDQRAQTWRINQAAEALKAAGYAVTVEIDEDDRRTFAEAEAERVERSKARAERLAERAEKAAGRAEALRERADHHAAWPPGQPILIGHHSEARHRRDLDRVHKLTGRSIQEGKYAAELARRSETAEGYERARNNLGTTLRRIKKLEADLRRVERQQERATGEWAEELRRLHAEWTEELAYWRDVVAAAEEDGVRVWSAADFTRGDFVRTGGRWYEVLRVNAKSLTVPGGPDIRPVITQENRAYSWDDRLPYDKVTGRRSAEEMAAALAPAPQD